ncbi:MAG TPA: alpha/beta fold hydrolase [Woeseiaceae bacterium]|nr:alpha/beta fold hydrolase [Woeseiaceae bacterium]
MSAGTIVFVPGIWMPGSIMTFLKRQLETRHGFAGRLFGYWAVRVGLDENAALLSEFAANAERQAGGGPVHLVGHSLGGVLALRMLARHPDAPEGRVVCLGSPLCGSRAASELRRWRWGQEMLGRTITAGVLEDPATHWCDPVTARREVGIIAGNRSIGGGRLLAGFEDDNDGTVSIPETRLPGVKRHLVMPVTHTGLVWSAEVADRIAAFLRRGDFDL